MVDYKLLSPFSSEEIETQEGQMTPKYTLLIGGWKKIWIHLITLDPESLFITSCCFCCSHVQLFVTPWTAARQAPLSSTISQSWLKLMSFESMMPLNQLILCHPLLLLPSVFTSDRVILNVSALHIRCSKYWSSSISPSNEYWYLLHNSLPEDKRNMIINS